MQPPVTAPIKPMLAKAVTTMPTDGHFFEPKWDGFRCILFKNGDDIVLGSRNEKPLTRYFPELLEPLRTQLPDHCVLDGELIVVVDNKLDFAALQQRIHPAKSRVDMLAAETPAVFVAFDILALGDHDLRSQPFEKRRQQLETVFADIAAPLYVTPATQSNEQAQRWFTDFEGAGLDGLIMKPLTEPYVENKRTQLKLKHVRSADCVVAGFRWHKDGKGVGSLLLGLYNEQDELRHVGVAASFTAKRRAELIDELTPLTSETVGTHPWADWGNAIGDDRCNIAMQGAPNRWNAKKSNAWVPVQIEHVAEVKYSTTLGGRFRDVTKMLRWRPDKTTQQCTVEQLVEPEPYDANAILRLR